MCRILVYGKNNTHPDPDTDRAGCYKKGMMVVVRPDGHIWGVKEQYPNFVSIDLPEVSTEKVQKYINHQLLDSPLAEPPIYRRRRWILRWNDLPQSTKTKFNTVGKIVIKVGTYDGPYDYTWAQIKAYFRDVKLGVDETEDL